MNPSNKYKWYLKADVLYMYVLQLDEEQQRPQVVGIKNNTKSEVKKYLLNMLASQTFSKSKSAY